MPSGGKSFHWDLSAVCKGPGEKTSGSSAPSAISFARNAGV